MVPRLLKIRSVDATRKIWFGVQLAGPFLGSPEHAKSGG